MKPKIENKSYAELGKEAGFVEGARVKVLRGSSDYENGWDEAWVSLSMDESIGKEFIIQYVTDKGSINFQDDGFDYPWHVCELVEE